MQRIAHDDNRRTIERKATPRRYACIRRSTDHANGAVRCVIDRRGQRLLSVSRLPQMQKQGDDKEPTHPATLAFSSRCRSFRYRPIHESRTIGRRSVNSAQFELFCRYVTAHSGTIPHRTVSRLGVRVPEWLCRRRLLPPKELVLFLAQRQAS